MGLFRFLLSIGETPEEKEARWNRKQQEFKEWEARQREDELEEEYDEIDGIEDADY